MHKNHNPILRSMVHCRKMYHLYKTIAFYQNSILPNKLTNKTYQIYFGW